MEQTQTPTSNVTKGLIIALVVALLDVGFYFSGYPMDSNLRYVIYGAFIVGIIWSCISYGKQLDGNVSFGNVFAHGFRVTAVVTLLMIVFELVFSFIFPEIKDKMLEAVRAKMVTNPKVTPDMIKQTVDIYTKWFRLIIVAGTLFGYIFIGILASLLGAALTKRKSS